MKNELEKEYQNKEELLKQIKKLEEKISIH